MFGAKEDDLIKSFGVLTRVLDGEGLQTDSGVHGRRGYTGDYLFMLLGGTPPIAPRVFKIMGNFGSRLFFLALHTPEEQEDDLIAQNMGEDRKSREIACQKITGGFLRTLWADNQSGVEWNKTGDPEFCLRVVARCARLLAHLRGAINVWPVGEDGKLTHSIPTIEKPNRINCLFYNLARGHALACGRRQLTTEDLWPVLDLTFDSAPGTRAKLFRGLIEAGGSLTTSDMERLLRCSPPTARKEMEALAVLGVVHKSEFAYDPKGQRENEISLDSRFEWFGSGECKALLKGMEGPAQGANPFSPTEAAGIAVTLQSEKEIAPCASIELPQLGDEKDVTVRTPVANTAHHLLVDLAACIQVETRDGLTPKGHPDCEWATDLNVPWEQFYPAEWTGVLDYLEGRPNEEQAVAHLCALLHKIECQAARGTPLISNYREWHNGGYPSEFETARAYVQDKKSVEVLMKDGQSQ